MGQQHVCAHVSAQAYVVAVPDRQLSKRHITHQPQLCHRATSHFFAEDLMKSTRQTGDMIAVRNVISEGL